MITATQVAEHFLLIAEESGGCLDQPPDEDQIREWANRPEVAAEIARGLEELQAGRTRRW